MLDAAVDFVKKNGLRIRSNLKVTMLFSVL